MRQIVFRLGLDDSERSYVERAFALLALALTAADVEYLRAHRAPPLKATRLAADDAERGGDWKGIAAALETGSADAMSLACWRCAEHLVRGFDARPRIEWSPDGQRYRVIIDGPNGLEEPYGVIGWKTKAREAPLTADVRIALRLFGKESERDYSERVLRIGLGALTSADVMYLRTHAVASLHRSGVRYRAEPFPREEWKGVRAVIEDGHGDCEDLASWRAAEHLVRGRPAVPAYRWRRVGRLSVYHIVVRHVGSAQIEDPSLELGMGRDGATLAELMPLSAG